MTVTATSYSVCPGSHCTLTASGANSYTWTSSSMSVASNTVAVGPGSYTVLANSGTCMASQSINIGTALPLNVQLSASSLTTCISSNFPPASRIVTLNASGAGSYVWQPYNQADMTYSLGPVTHVRTGASACYTVTGYNSVCSGSAAVCLTVIPQFNINVSPAQSTICAGGSGTVGVINVGMPGGGPPSAFSYSWT